ncbi:phosphatase [Raoultella ornithinolytica]|uniref:phosphatase n=1 Tax=Raoultella ornithinolytica TaxID=54291 RepID=UPI000CF3016D|nr:phosphatase [Raoultella ornithinolytica]PQH14155.1 phosphatase [Raoultella ornithinolytica]PQH38464.1 phosphatase [Raoultella ornithinolytica]
MPGDFLDIAITPDVMDVQHEMGSDGLWQSPYRQRRGERFGASEEEMIATRDSVYLATLSQTGWPYIQHRGGPPGFLHLLDDATLAMADFGGNRQYITTVEVLAKDDDPGLLARVTPDNYRARVERLFRFHLQAFDWNCPQHITPRYSARQVAEYSQTLQQRIQALEQENLQLQQQLTLKGE